MLKAELTNMMKLKISRKRTECRDYGNLPKVCRKSNSGKKDKSKCESKSKYEESNYRKRMLMRIKQIKEICHNSFQIGKMSSVTLTFDPEKDKDMDFTNLDTAHKEFDKFIKRMNHHFDNFVYIATFARHENQNWHYHMLCNIDKTVTEKQIEKIWKNGRVEKNMVNDKDYFKNSIIYLVKNLNESGAELKGRSGYKRSRNAEPDKIITLDKLDSDECDYFANKIMQSKSVNKSYDFEKSIGIMKEYTNKDTGEVDCYVDLGADLSSEFKNKGYENLNIKMTSYSIDVLFDEMFPPLKTATLKKHKNTDKKK